MIVAPPILVLHRCRACGQPAVPVDLSVSDGPAIRKRTLCHPCLERAHAEAAENRRLFDLLVAEGVSAECSDKMLVAKVEHDFALEERK